MLVKVSVIGILLSLSNFVQPFSFQPNQKNFKSLELAEKDSLISEKAQSTLTRRQSLSFITKATISSVLISVQNRQNIVLPAFADEVSQVGTVDHPVAIIGGGGRTGMAVAENLAGELGQMNGVIMTRSGRDPFQVIKLPPSTKQRLAVFDGKVDVRDQKAVLTAFEATKPSVVVFAASASKQGGNSFEVDDEGVENVAYACKSAGAKLILVSALAVDRPESKSFKITNTIGGYLDKIMDAKLNGENKVKEILGKDNYVIIRPGVLLNGKSKNGASDVELNQGDTIGGGISRDELAGVVVGAIQSGRSGITVEAYRKSTATKLQPEFVVPSGNELTATTYKGLFSNAKEDL